MTLALSRSAHDFVAALDWRHWSHEDEIANDIGVAIADIPAAIRELLQHGVIIEGHDGLYRLSKSTATVAKSIAQMNLAGWRSLAARRAHNP